MMVKMVLFLENLMTIICTAAALQSLVGEENILPFVTEFILK